MLRTRARLLLTLSMLASLALAACGGGGSQSASTTTIGDDSAARSGPPEGWPRVLVVTPGPGPALFLGPEDDSPPIGFVTTGTRVRLDGPPRNGRVPVTVAGGLSARGWIPLGRIGAYTAQRGRIEGTPTYVGVGDLVSIVERTGEGFRVQVAPWMGREENDRLGPWTGVVPADWLTPDRPAAGDTGLNEGTSKRLPAGREVPVYDRPNGRVIATIPATDPPQTIVVLRERSGWAGVRAGVGPFLVGYVQGELADAEGAPRASWEPPSGTGGDSAPQRIQEEEGTLYRVRRGTRVRFLDRVIGRLRTEGWARELGRVSDGRIDVYVAVDDSTALRGLVRERDLTAAQGSGSGASAGRGGRDELGDDDEGDAASP